MKSFSYSCFSFLHIDRLFPWPPRGLNPSNSLLPSLLSGLAPPKQRRPMRLLSAGESCRANYHLLLRAWLPLAITSPTRCSFPRGFVISHAEPFPQEGCFLVLEEGTAIGSVGTLDLSSEEPLWKSQEWGKRQVGQDTTYFHRLFFFQV
uniref:Uncharacterized protein n=1 Tax=Molossus molossus TaxID=27622 RepID=A0A7J8ERR7_MOLMO|nr:hypothetical protein HJG59_008753 [Molossus molossus]